MEGSIFIELHRQLHRHEHKSCREWSKAGSDTSQIPSNAFFSYNNGVFTLHGVYFSVTLKKSKQKKVKQTTFIAVYLVGSSEKEFEEFRVAGLRPMGVSVRTHLSSQDSQFNLFIGFSVEDMSRTVWMCVCVCVCVCVSHP